MRPADQAPGRPTRRRFIKGSSLALPAVMTLHSHSAQALVSITCGQKALDTGETAVPVIDIGEDDDHLRENVVVYDELFEETVENNGEEETVLVPDGQAKFFRDDYANVWRDVSGNSLGESMPQSCNYVEGGVGHKRAIIHISANDGAPVSCGAHTPPTEDAIITSAAGACMASLVTRSQA
jgi:hypothetical protein